MSGELQTLNQQNKMALWAERITNCRNSKQGVKTWCRENGICEATFYKWQKKLFEMAQQQEPQFAEISPKPRTLENIDNVAVTVRLPCAEASIHNGADRATVEFVLRLLQSC